MLGNLLDKKEKLKPEYQRPTTKWWAFSIQDVFKRLDTSEKGLEFEEAKRRQEKYGINILPREKRPTALLMIKQQINSPVVIVLLVAGVISFLLGDNVDAIVIFFGLAINILTGFVQEFRAEKAFLSLSQIVVNYAKVLWHGEEKLIKSTELTIGDIVFLTTGDKVPADMRLIKSYDLKVNEAILTGETEPKEKDEKKIDEKNILSERKNMAYMGTLVTSGHAIGVVVEIGQQTEVGRIFLLSETIKARETALQKKLKDLAKMLTKIMLSLSVFIFLFGVLSGYELKTFFATAVAVAVAAIPEGLAITVTVVLAIGMQRILKQNALVKNLLAAETLGSTDVICIDKTGTLTEGKMRVVKIATADNEFNLDGEENVLSPEVAEEQLFLMRLAILCNNAYLVTPAESGVPEIVGDSTEQALIMAASSLGLNKEKMEQQYPRLDEIPFSPEHKFMMTLHQFDEQNNIIYLKGAPEKVLFFANYLYSHHIKHHLELNDYRREKILKVYEEMSKAGLRVMAFGYKKISLNIKAISPTKQAILPTSHQPMAEIYTNFVLVGLIGIKDPVRPSAKETILTTDKAGLETVMITGDNKNTALAIAKEAGIEVISDQIIDGEELQKITESALNQKIKNIKIFARTTPEQKLKIVRAWQNTGAIVAMTGDGVNDAPALKQANIGIALGGATDTAKEAADIILLDNNLAVIVEAIKQGRIIFANLKKIVLYLLSDAFTEMIFITLALIFKWPLPIIASQIIWVNLIDDTLPALALTQDEGEKNIMSKKKFAQSQPIIDAEDKILIFLISLITALGVLLTFYLFYHNNPENLALARTMAFSFLGIDSLLYVFSIRNLKLPLKQTRIWHNKFLLVGIALGFVLQLLAVYSNFLQNIFKTVELNLWHWLYIFSLSFLIIGAIEIVKWFYNKK